MCVCKRNRTDRNSMRMGWDHMVSEASAERLCPSESSKMQLCGHRQKAEKTDWDGVCSCVSCAHNKTSYIPCVKVSFLHDN